MQTLKSTTTKLNNKIELIGQEGSIGKALIIGVFHGDEPQGKFLIEEYLKKQGYNPSSGTLILRRGTKTNLLFIPCLNPDGMQLNRRTNVNNVDLNRNFPTQNWGRNEGNNATCDDCTTDYYGGKSPASEIETRFVTEIVEEYKPSVILTLHAPYKVVNYDGPAKNIAEKISEIIKYPTEASIGYPTPGSFGNWAGVERQIPTITLELDEKCPVQDLLEPVHKIFELLE